MPRPLLSGSRCTGLRVRSRCVAGVYAPAFVERSNSQTTIDLIDRVAGVYAPAFVERLCVRQLPSTPSACRWGLCPGLC